MANTTDPKKLVYFETHHLVEELEKRGFIFHYVERGDNNNFSVDGPSIVLIKTD